MESIQVRLHKVYSSSECVRKTPDLPSHQNPFHSFRQIIRQTFSVVSVSSSVNDHSALSCSARVLALLVYVICGSKEIDSYYDSKLLFLPCHLQRGTWNMLIFVGNTKYRSQKRKNRLNNREISMSFGKEGGYQRKNRKNKVHARMGSSVCIVSLSYCN